MSTCNFIFHRLSHFSQALSFFKDSQQPAKSHGLRLQFNTISGAMQDAWSRKSPEADLLTMSRKATGLFPKWL